MAGGRIPTLAGATGRGHAHGRPPGGSSVSARATCCSRRRRPAGAGAIRSTVPSRRCRPTWTLAPSRPTAATTLYGAVLDAAGRVDAAATAAGREARRAARRGWPARRQRPGAARGRGARARRPARRPVGRRPGCPGHALDALPLRPRPRSDARELARVRRLASSATPVELGPAVRLSDDVEVRMYACPGLWTPARLSTSAARVRRTARTFGWRWRSGPPRAAARARPGRRAVGSAGASAAPARGALAHGPGVSRR